MCTTTAVLEQTQGSRRYATPPPTPTPDLNTNHHPWTMVSSTHGCVIYVVLFTLAFTLLCTGTQAHEHSLLKMQYTDRHVRHVRHVHEDCRVNCTNVKPRPVCGTDGRTYNSKCHIRRLKRCEGRTLEIKSKGRCKGLSKCQMERRQARKEGKKPGSSAEMYVAKCKKDGTYAEVQCHTATGYCWCVAGDGKPIPGSSVRGRKINCRNSKGKFERRRSGKADKDSSGCSPTDRATFNTNLIALFSEEFAQIPKPTPPSYPGAPKDLPIKSESDSILDTPEKRVIEWKFSELDSEKDNKLKKKEIKSLKRMVKKLVTPKACARNFDRYCDLNQDKSIARNEWSVCLGVDINNPPKRKDTLFGNLPLIPGISTEDTGDQQNDIPPRRNCDEERRIAVENDKNDPEGRIFIPDCVTGGKYKKEQCHKITGYCWCVDETSGKPIPGTSTHRVMPDCTNQKIREFKGCPYNRKKQFLTELMDDITLQMTETSSNSSASRNMPEPNPDHSLEERAARWKLHMLDRNRNLILERRELKSFKKRELRKTKSLRKCGRNFIRYCDENKDKKITVDEWIDCLGVTEKDRERSLAGLPSRRKGENPFEKILRP